MFYWLLKYAFGSLIRLIWVSKVDGLENVPKKGAAVIAANHSSYFDFLTTIAVLPRRIYYLAGEVFYKSWFWKPLLVLTGQIKVDRNSSDKSLAINAGNGILQSGNVLGIYPEGTRSRDGRMHKAYNGVAKFALNNKVDIVPLAIGGAFEIMSPADKWPRFGKKCSLTFLEPLRYEEIKNFSEEKIVQELLMPRIASQLGDKYE